MSEHTDLLPLRSPEEGGPAFELVRRGYDRDQVENHLGWLEDQLRNAEIARDAAEQAAATATADAEIARDELESGRPKWHEFGERITEILSLAEQQGADIRAQRTREANELLADARQAAIDAERLHASKIREAEATADQTITAAQAEADRILLRAQQQAAEEERVASRRLADLERQRDAVNAQLTRLHDTLAHALSPAISVEHTYDVDSGPDGADATPATSQVSMLADEEQYPTQYPDGGYEDDKYTSSAVSASSAARTARDARSRR